MARRLANVRRTLSCRLRWTSPQGITSEVSDPGLMARSGAYLFGSGASLALIWLFMPTSGQVDTNAMLAMVACSYAMVALLFGAFDRIPPWAFRAFLMAFTLVVSGMIYYSGKSASPYSFFYVWAALYALYFFRPAEAARQVLFMGFCYAAVLVAHHMTVTGDTVTDLVVAVEDSAAQWTIAFGTLVVATALFGLLKERLDALIRRLTDAVTTDALTGLLNRRGLEEAFEMEVERARRNDAPLSLLVGDLDRFKALNDNYGHPAGDRALERLGECLAGGVRRVDRVGRLGGEEFALVLPDTDENQAYVLAERLRSIVREQFADDFNLTISFGIAAFPKHGLTTSALLKEADQALYTAKEFGRDCSVIYSPETADILQGDSHRTESTLERRVASLIGLASSMDTAEHSQMVGRYSKLIAVELGLPKELVERVQLAGVLHDIGKIGVADAIVNKAGPLTAEEWAEMEKHPGFGARMLERAELWDIAEWVAAHHERPDGKGYPKRLKQGEIPLEARIVAVADAYEAMTTDRVYRPSIGHTAARAELRRGAGSQFDARVVEAFLNAHEPSREQAGSAARRVAA